MNAMSMERLEGRLLLAGNVTAEVVDGTLWIKGDRQGNNILIESNRVAGEVLRLSGQHTTINGDSASLDLEGVDTIRADVGKGDDTLRMVWLAIEQIIVRSGSGEDFISVQGSILTGPARIRTEGGNDVISIYGQNLTSGINGINFETGDGDDLIYLSDTGLGRRPTVRAGAGDDYLFHEGYSYADKAIFQLGKGNNREGGGLRIDQVMQEYDFFEGARGWRGAFADYFSDRESEHELVALEPTSAQSPGQFFISGRNITDDLFMYLTRVLTAADGLKPNMAYHVRFEVALDSNAQSGCIGIGGAPGESVFLKAGATATPPKTFVDDEGIVRLNIDHGDQGNSGAAASVIGNIANGLECGTPLGGDGYAGIERRGVHTAIAKTNSKGRLYLIVGTDSGFEGTTALFYSRINVQLVEAWKLPEKGPRSIGKRFEPVV